MDSLEEREKKVYRPPHKRFVGDDEQQPHKQSPVNETILYANGNNAVTNGKNHNYNLEKNNISHINGNSYYVSNNNSNEFQSLNDGFQNLNLNNNTIMNQNTLYYNYQQTQNLNQSQYSNYYNYNNYMNGNNIINNVNGNEANMNTNVNGNANINTNNVAIALALANANANLNNNISTNTVTNGNINISSNTNGYNYDKTSNNQNGMNRFSNYVSRNNIHHNNDNTSQNGMNSNYYSNNYNSYYNYNNSYNYNHHNNTNRFNNSRFDDEDLESELFKDESHEMVQGINFAQYDRIPVEVSGDQVPPPINLFDESALCQLLLENVKRSKYEKPTPIQKYAIPCVLQGRDLMACAQTGSGKTAAFLLPIIHQLFQTQNGRRNPKCCYPIVVILAPTRELAIQIHVQARKFLFESPFRSVVVYGGVEPRKQMRELLLGCDLLVATPGRLNDFMERQMIKLDCVKFCVLDEADRMMDMGFMPQIKLIINDMPSKQNRNTLMFSATFPVEIQHLAQEFLENYIFIAIGRVGSTTSFIKQKLRHVEESQKLTELTQMLQTCDGLKLIFVEKKRDATNVERELLRAGFSAISIHGDRTQKEREYALQAFRTARIPILVATDVAARGLDIPNVMWVFNFDLPNNIDSYVHRIGRTGRCGNEGNAVAFVNENNKPILKDLLKLLKETKQDVPQWFADLVYKSHPRDSYFNQNSYNKKRNQFNFGSRDYRTQRHFNNNPSYKNRNDETVNNNNSDGNMNINNVVNNNEYNNNYNNNNNGNSKNNISNISCRREFIQTINDQNTSQSVQIESNQFQNWQNNDSW